MPNTFKKEARKQANVTTAMVDGCYQEQTCNIKVIKLLTNQGEEKSVLSKAGVRAVPINVGGVSSLTGGTNIWTNMCTSTRPATKTKSRESQITTQMERV